MPSTCTICRSRDAIYTRRYSGESLCSRCFCLSIENKVKATIARYDMLRYDDRVAIGVSGGKDSMALLYILAKLEKSFPKAKLAAVTVDEGIRGYRDEALKIAEKGCRRLGVEQIVASFKQSFGCTLDEIVGILSEREKSGKGLTPCAYCGVLRRRALNSAVRSLGATKLATAHNLDDETQTILLNVLHGDPLRLARVRPVSIQAHSSFVCRIKPFCEVLERETAFYAYLRGIEFQNIPCPYSTAALRNDLRFMLNRMEEKHAGLKYTVYRSVEKLRFPIQNVMKIERLRNCTTCGEPTIHEICQPCKMLRSLGLDNRQGECR